MQQFVFPQVNCNIRFFSLLHKCIYKITYFIQAVPLKNIFYVPNFAPIRLILKLSGPNSIESEIALRKLLFLGRMITVNKLTPTVRNLFHCRVDSFFDESISSIGILPTECSKNVPLFDQA